jgi:hypothetical protein
MSHVRRHLGMLGVFAPDYVFYMNASAEDGK